MVVIGFVASGPWFRLLVAGVSSRPRSSRSNHRQAATVEAGSRVTGRPVRPIVPPVLRVRLLGGLEVEGIDTRELGSRKARTLVKVLALARGAPVSPDAVVDALWPGDGLPAKPMDQVGVLVSRLRSALGPGCLVRSGAGWSLAVDWLDVAELDARVEEAAARLAAGNPGAARAAVRAALALDRGELLADEPDARWAEPARAGVARTLARARLVGAEAALAAGDALDAAGLAETALAGDEYDEAALRLLMRADAAAGRPARALAAYARVRERLAEDLGVDPAPATEELHTAILLGDLSEPSLDARPAVATLVGRDAELRALDGFLERRRNGSQVLVLVEGDAGIGKTALVTHWAARLPPDVVVLRGRCDELGRDLPLQPVLDGLATHLRELDADEAARCLGEAQPIIGQLLGHGREAAGAGATTVSDAVAGRAFLFASLLAAVERMAAGGIVVVVCEDVHLAGVMTVEWLRFAVRRGSRVLVVATARPGDAPLRSPDLLELGPLDLSSAIELVGAERGPDLHARSGGNPLFLLELARAASPELPGSVRDAVAARVDGLGEAAATLRAAAVLGSVVDVDLLAGVTDRSLAVLLEHLDAGLRAHVLEERSAAFAFRHELVREALAAGTTAARRAYVHRQAARVLSGRAGHDPMEVAFHAREAGDTSGAAKALVEAAALASAWFDAALADRLLSEAIALEDSPSARGARARVRITRFELDAAEADAARAVELGGGAEALEVAGWAAYYRRDYELAGQRAEEGAERADDVAVRASCLTLSGRVLHASGDLDPAEERLRRAVSIAPAPVRGVAQVFLGGLRVHRGEVAEGGELVQRALLDVTHLSHPFAQHHAHLFRVLSLAMRGRPVEALAAVDAGTAAATQAGESGERFLAVQTNLRSWVVRCLGRTEEAIELTERVLELAAEPSLREMCAAAELDRIEELLVSGDLAAAGAALRSSAAMLEWNGTHGWHHHQRYRTLSARHLLAVGDAERALEVATAVVEDAAARRTSRYGCWARVVAAQAALSCGEPADLAEVDAALVALEGCAGLEAWRITAELAAAAGEDRWWRDAERRAATLVVRAGDMGETLRRHVAATFAGLGRG